MSPYMTIKEAAAMWNCSERTVQMLCKKGSIAGAYKASGIWLLPESSVRPDTDRTDTLPPFSPEKLYGATTNVFVSTESGVNRSEGTGCTITNYPVMDGITLVFQDIYEEHIDYENARPALPRNLIAIQHCCRGRFEATYPDGEYVYMGPGSLSINLPAWSPVSNSFPLKHYYGFYIAILPEIAEASIKKLESILGPLGIDFSVILEKLVQKNKLAFYPVDEKLNGLLSSIYPSKEPYRKEQLKFQVLELLQILSSREIHPTEPVQYFPSEQVKAVKKIRNYLVSHLDQHINLDVLAEQFNLSLTGMKNCFKGVYGKSIGKYIREYRIQKGAELLLSSHMLIIDIAGSLGYENASKFSETFAKYYGMTPSKYRKFYCPNGVAVNRTE